MMISDKKFRRCHSCWSYTSASYPWSGAARGVCRNSSKLINTVLELAHTAGHEGIQVWADISIDFIEGLPKVHGKSVILTVVNRFSKYAHFIALGHPNTAVSVTRAFFDGIVRLHGFPASIFSEQDPVFTGNFWRDLFKMSGV